MSRNRVEELEAQVAELQSTVRGLTEELVESKERIRVLEAELDADVPTRVPERRSDGFTKEAREAEPDDVEAATAEAAAAAPADTDNSEESESGDETGENPTDDIIVA